MRLTVDGDLRALVRDGEPPLSELQEAEAALRIAYADAMGDTEYRFYCGAVKEVAMLEITLTQIEDLITVLRETYVKAFADKLNQLVSSSFVFDITNLADYDDKLDKCFRRSRGTKIALDLAHMKLAKLEEKYTNGNKPTREYYYSALLTLSGTQGYKVSSEISAWEFCELLRRHNKIIEQQQTPTNGRRVNR